MTRYFPVFLLVLLVIDRPVRFADAVSVESIRVSTQRRCWLTQLEGKKVRQRKGGKKSCRAKLLVSCSVSLSLVLIDRRRKLRSSDIYIRNRRALADGTRPRCLNLTRSSIPGRRAPLVSARVRAFPSASRRVNDRLDVRRAVSRLPRIMSLLRNIPLSRCVRVSPIF